MSRFLQALFSVARSTIALWLLVGLLGASLVYNGTRRDDVPTFTVSQLTPAQRAELACGPVSLAIAAQLAGEMVTADEILQKCRFRLDGVDSEELRRLAKAHGLQLRERTLNWNELLAQPNPVILHYKEGHFVVAHPAETKASPVGQIRVYDPNGAARYVSRLDLEKSWVGRSFIVDHAAHSAKTNPLATDRWWIDQGAQLTTSTSTVEYEFQLHNVGATQLTLAVDHTSCSCTSATIDENKLAPGKSTWLRAVVAIDRKRGPYYEKVWIVSEDSQPAQKWCLTLSGTAVTEVKLSQTAIFLGAVHPGESVNGSIVIQDRGDKSLQVSEARVDFESVPQVSEIDCQFFIIRPGTQHADVIRRHPSVRAGDWYLQVAGKVAANANCGNFNGTLRITGVCDGEQIALECPVIGRVESDVHTTPSAVVIREDVTHCEVSVSRAGARPVRVNSAAVENLPGVACEQILQKSPQLGVVLLSIKSNAIEGKGQRTGQLRLNLGSDGERLVPIVDLRDAPVVSEGDSGNHSLRPQ